MSSVTIFITVFSVVMISRTLILKAVKNLAKALCLTIILMVKTLEVSEEIDYDRGWGIFRCR